LAQNLNAAGGPGEPKLPVRMVANPGSATPKSVCSKAWTEWCNDFAKLHVDRRYPAWNQHVSIDAAFNCDLLAALSAINGSMIGASFTAEQLKFMCLDVSHKYVAPVIPSDTFMNVHVASDSIHQLDRTGESEGGIKEELDKTFPNLEFKMNSGGAANELANYIAEWAEMLDKVSIGD
jgi:hypothetical protein